MYILIEDLYKNRGFSKDKLNSILKDYADKYIYGCDIDPLLYRISKSYMAIVGDGKSNIYNFDSLEPYENLDSNFKKRVKPGTVDVITTNPPFGTKIDDTRDYVLEQYELGHKLINGVPTKTLVDGQDPDKLFVEKDILYLKDATNTEDGGRMVIVLPKQNLSGAQEESVEFRKWLLTKVQITAIVDLPREAFQPHTGTKTSLVFLKKVKSIPENYPIFMAVSEAVGHDRRGNPLYKKDASGMNLLDDKGKEVIWNDLPEIYAQWKNYLLSGIVVKKEEEHASSRFVVHSRQILEDMVTDHMAGTMVSEHVIRVICDETIIDPYYVYAYLSTDGIGKILLEKGIYASVVDHITPDFVATIPIPRLKPEKEKEIADKVRAAEIKRDEANRVFLDERNQIESIMFGNINRNNISE